MEAPGMMYKTMRDEIAIEALKVLLAVDSSMLSRKTTAHLICMAAYGWADTMLKVRELSSKE
jgi:hypothetical protein